MPQGVHYPLRPIAYPRYEPVLLLTTHPRHTSLQTIRTMPRPTFPARTVELASLLLLLALGADFPTHAAAAEQPSIATKEEVGATVCHQ